MKGVKIGNSHSHLPLLIFNFDIEIFDLNIDSYKGKSIRETYESGHSQVHWNVKNSCPYYAKLLPTLFSFD